MYRLTRSALRPTVNVGMRRCALSRLPRPAVRPYTTDHAKETIVVNNTHMAFFYLGLAASVFAFWQIGQNSDIRWNLEMQAKDIDWKQSHEFHKLRMEIMRDLQDIRMETTRRLAKLETAKSYEGKGFVPYSPK
ncbi:hypothetical protein C8R45DRAFT_1110778 [Mycena sanguinolenta]|nr:hypothetical protein C8R45DRAFT_1110778 [Mycena sanguinolenta]